MVTCIAVGGLCQSRLNLEGKMSIPGEVSLCRYPTPAGTETDSWFGHTVPALNKSEERSLAQGEINGEVERGNPASI